MDKFISTEDAVKTAWMILEGLGYAFGENPQLNQTVSTVFDTAPAADVRPVKRGKWIKASGSWFTPGGDPVWQCSVCGKGRHVYGVEHGTYGADISDGQWVSCPNCGAYMVG